MSSQQEKNRKIILQKYIENPLRTQKSIAKDVGVSRETVSRVLKKFSGSLTVERKKGSGKKVGPHDKKLEKKVCSTIKARRGMSTRDVAKKCQTSSSMVQRVKRRNNMKCYKKQKQPKRTVPQKNRAIVRSRRLYDLLLSENACIVMDDETYVKLDFQTLPGPQYYIKKKDEILPEKETHIGLEKFGEKLLVWQAICSCGDRSRIFVTKATVNKEIYINECLKKRLLPFIRSHNGPTIFWPDLASAHYAKDTINFLNNHNIDFVPKEANPPNVPELRPIERYWALVKAQLKKEKRGAKNQEDFKKIWNRSSKRVTKNTVQTLMEGVRRKVRAFQRQPQIKI